MLSNNGVSSNGHCSEEQKQRLFGQLEQVGEELRRLGSELARVEPSNELPARAQQALDAVQMIYWKLHQS